jgi:RNA polymerase sigma-70 factor (ECF subfamily)
MQLVDGEVAHDVVQDVFVSVWLARATWQAPAGSLAYLYRAVRNRALKRIRHEGVVQRTQSALAVLPASVASDQGVDALEFDAALSAALAELPERRRTAFLLRAVDELGYDAIGSVLGISGPGAYKQVVAAIRFLRERLARFAG